MGQYESKINRKEVTAQVDKNCSTKCTKYCAACGTSCSYTYRAPVIRIKGIK